ncbi:MAG TPA: carboxypeptidase-like regulatory domain-containing protein, partial [Flavisolibacter sp.]|nr:carboxypeptidase-like regulatory domain-containing protein [Flavisolibacter sp.]
MKKALFPPILFLLCIFSFAHLSAPAQVTTATLTGMVKDANGAALSGATVVVEFPDAGVRRTLLTKSDGRFTLSNQRVGGPYRVTVSYVNYETTTTDNIFLELGQNNYVELSLKESAAQLQGVTVSATGSRIFDSKRTGASTNISSAALRNLPTISRSADDYLRLTPSAAPTYNGLSFAGRNGQYNNFSLD